MNKNLNVADAQSKLPLVYFMLSLTIMHICNIMAFKIITIHGISFAFTGLFFPLSFLFLTVLNESYGHVETERHIFYILISQSILILVISAVIRINIGNNLNSTDLYYGLFKNLYRLLISSNLAVGLSYYFTSFVNSKFKCWLLGKSWWLRFVVANGIGKAILVLATYPINFYGTLSFDQIAHLCLNTWIFKMCIAFFLLSAAKPLININKKIDRADVYDTDISYHPKNMYRAGNYGKTQEQYN